jgi:hypothetical protein
LPALAVFSFSGRKKLNKTVVTSVFVQAFLMFFQEGLLHFYHSCGTVGIEVCQVTFFVKYHKTKDKHNRERG